MDLKVIGTKLKDLRKSHGLTLDELAARSELSKGFLSQLERGNMSPSLENLNYILESLGTTLGDFFKKYQNMETVFSDKYLSKHKDKGVMTKWLIPTSQSHKMEPVIVSMDPNKIIIIEPFQGELFGKVISGEAILFEGENKTELNNQHTFYITRKINIKIESKNKCEILLVSTPPIF